jgi:hypothetical protein
MNHRCFVIAATAVLGVSLSDVAEAQPKPTVAVLGLEVIDDSGTIDDAAVAFARALTDGLRRRAMLGKGPYTLAPNSNKDLLELKLLSDCGDEGRACMAEIGRELGAERLLYGKVEKRPRGFQVSLKLLNTQTGAMERTLSDVVPGDGAAGAALESQARSLYNRLAGLPDTGSIWVRANVDDGTVYVDGEVATTLAQGEATVSGLEPGSHALALESEGYGRYEIEVSVAAGERTDVAAAMRATAPEVDVSPEVPKERGYGSARVLFWSSLVATGASVTAFAVTGIQVRGFEGDKQDQFEALLDENPDTSGQPVDENGDFRDVCKIAQANRDLPSAGALIDTCDKGRARAKLANVFIGTSVASALLATYFYYRGYVDSDDDRSSEPAVRVTPSVGPDSVGAGLAIEF